MNMKLLHYYVTCIHLKLIRKALNTWWELHALFRKRFSNSKQTDNGIELYMLDFRDDVTIDICFSNAYIKSKSSSAKTESWEHYGSGSEFICRHMFELSFISVRQRRSLVQDCSWNSNWTQHTAAGKYSESTLYLLQNYEANGRNSPTICNFVVRPE